AFRPVWLPGEVSVLAIRESASPAPGRRPAAAVPLLLKALGEYKVLERPNWASTLEDGFLGEAQVERVRRTVYEELLWLANDVLRRKEDHRSGRKLDPAAAARAALAYLADAERARRPTRALHELRAGCLAALGEKAAAGDARRLAD